jgi:hypothetical protein
VSSSLVVRKLRLPTKTFAGMALLLLYPGAFEAAQCSAGIAIVQPTGHELHPFRAAPAARRPRSFVGRARRPPGLCGARAPRVPAGADRAEVLGGGHDAACGHGRGGGAAAVRSGRPCRRGFCPPLAGGWSEGETRHEGPGSRGEKARPTALAGGDSARHAGPTLAVRGRGFPPPLSSRAGREPCERQAWRSRRYLGDCFVPSCRAGRDSQ